MSLLDACSAVTNNKISRANAVLKVSKELREKEMVMQISIMTVLILELSSGLRGASKLFIKLYSGHIREVGSEYEKRAVMFSILNLLAERRLQF